MDYAKDILAIEHFFKDVKRFKPKQALDMHKKLKKKLEKIIYGMPRKNNNSTKWKKINLRLLEYMQQLEYLIGVAKECKYL